MEINNNHRPILVVDDEADIREILQFNLENEGYIIDEADSAEQALKILSPKHQLILLDVMMEGISGFKLADQLRKSGNNIPIIFLTAKDTENDMLTGFSIGGDDYISKPFSIKEVIARVKNILKRTHTPETSLDSIIEIDDLRINIDTKIVTIKDSIVELTKTEYNILVMLLRNEEQTFSRSDILDKAWEGDGIVLDRTVDVHIARLRKKIAEYGSFIINRSGYGYSFNTNYKKS